jgi:hypothetical protein
MVIFVFLKMQYLGLQLNVSAGPVSLCIGIPYIALSVRVFWYVRLLWHQLFRVGP